MIYGIWAHVHRDAYGNGDADLRNKFIESASGTKDEMAALIRSAPYLSSSHRSFTVLARTPELTDEEPNAICESCKGPTRHTRDMLTTSEIWTRWTREEIETEIRKNPKVRQVHEDCWCFPVSVEHEDGSTGRYGIYVYTTPRPDGLFPYAGISPQYVRDGNLIRGEEILLMAREERQPKLAVRRQ